MRTVHSGYSQPTEHSVCHERMKFPSRRHPEGYMRTHIQWFFSCALFHSFFLPHFPMNFYFSLSPHFFSHHVKGRHHPYANGHPFFSRSPWKKQSAASKSETLIYRGAPGASRPTHPAVTSFLGFMGIWEAQRYGRIINSWAALPPP